MADKRIKYLAFQMMALQKKGGRYTGLQMAAARRIGNGSGSAADEQVVFGAMGVSKTGASAQRAGLKELSFPFQKLGDYANRINTIGQGGATGLAATVSMGHQISRDIQTLTKQQWFRDAVIAVAAKRMGDAARAPEFWHALSATARLAGTAVAYTAAAAAIAAGGISLVERFTGLGSNEALRAQRQGVALNRIEGVRMSPYERRADELELRKEERKAGFASIGAFLGLNGKTSGQMAEDIGHLRTRNQMNAGSIFGNDDKFREQARDRMYEKKYGTFFGHLAASFDRGGGWQFGPLGAMVNRYMKEGVEEKITDESTKSFAKVNELKKRLYELASEGAVNEAKGYQNQIAKELGRNLAWREPQIVFVNDENARAAARVFPATQQMRRLRSYE